MSTLIKDRRNAIRNGREGWNRKSLMEERVCVENVSKEIKGFIQREESREQKCDKPDCLTTNEIWRIDETLLRSWKCDGDFSRSHIDGHLTGIVLAAYRFNSKERGDHFGACEIVNSKGKTIAKGMLDGVCNAGTHHGPLQNAVEECDQNNHWEGHLSLEIEDGNDSNFSRLVFAEYVLDLTYRDDDRTQADILGTIEGCLLTDCA